MPVDIRNHPDAPDPELFEESEIMIEPVPQAEIERRRERGEVLLEDNVREREDLDVMAYISTSPDAKNAQSIGVAMYRLTQLFGTPQLPEYQAGEDISHRTDEVFKYLFRASMEDPRPEGIPEEWLLTVHDSHVRFAASVAEWRAETPDSEFRADDELALTTYALAQQLVTDAVACVYEDIPY